MFVTNSGMPEGQIQVSFFKKENEPENEQNIQNVSAIIFENNLFSKFKNLVTNFFNKRILIQLDQSVKNCNQAYVKVSELSQILKMSEKQIIKQTKDKSAKQISNYLKSEVLINKIVKLVPNLGKNEIRIALNELFKAGLTPDKIVEFMKEDLNNPQMVWTLLKLSGSQSNHPDMQNTYKFQINEANECVIINDQKEFKFTLNFNDAGLNKQVQENRDHLNKILEDIGISPTNLRNIITTANKISFDTILSLANEQPKRKKMFLNTFLHIGKSLRTSDQADSYFKSIKTKTFAYAIDNKDRIFIRYSKLSKGSYKQVDKAIMINNFTEQMLSDQVEKYVRIKPNKKSIAKYGLRFANFFVISDSYILKKLGISKFISGYNEFEAITLSGKVVAFQRQCDGDGKDLFGKPLKKLLNIFVDVGSALNHTHEKGYTHRDLKPENILFIGDEGRLADFGLSQPNGQISADGTPHYLPPEATVLKAKDIVIPSDCLTNEKIDSYGFGMTMLAILINQDSNSNKLPCFSLKRDEKAFDDEVKEVLYQELTSILNNSSISLEEKGMRIEILKVCDDLIKFKPEDRITCDAAKKRLQNIQNLESKEV
jgi:hypothetical protein